MLFNNKKEVSVIRAVSAKRGWGIRREIMSGLKGPSMEFGPLSKCSNNHWKFLNKY